MSRTFSKAWSDYELIDAGNSKKLERWGKVITIRPDRNAYFKSALTAAEWKQQASFEFIEKTPNAGEWIKLKNDAPTEWEISFEKIKLKLKLTKFKHLGIFPEQRTNWDFVADNLNEGEKFLNLFGYTGAVSLVARSKGADVFHCDSVKQIISWGKENMELSGLSDIHWVLEDAIKFAQREVKRGKKYHGIIMDPPVFGLGANKERWKIEDMFEELVLLGKQLKTEDGFIILNTYSPRLEINEIKQILNGHFNSKNFTCNKLCIESKSGKIIEYGEVSRIIS